MVKKIGPYRVEERLGVGGMGEVYKAFDDRLDRWVAIKRIRPDKEGAEDNRERFQREARATAKLNHTSIVHLYDIFQDGDSDCIVMEYVEGRTLDTMVMEGPLDPALTIRLGLEIASGLAEAHAKGIIHRDLKVENIIFTPDGHAKILDFGLAKPILSNELDTSLTGKGQLVGTSRAMSPEYVSGEEIDHRSDLFSLGVLLYEAATGHSPFKAHNTLATLKQVMLHTQTPAAQIYSQVPVDLSELIDQLLEKDPEDRPQNAEIVAEAFGRMSQQFSSGAILRPRNSSTGMHPAPGPSTFSASATAIEQLVRRPWLWLLVPALILTVGSAVWVRQQGAETFDVERSGDEAPIHWIVVKREKVVLADFENKTEEALLDDTVGFAFRVGLEQSRHAQVLTQSQVREVLARMELDPGTRIDTEIGLEICAREGAKALVGGSIFKLGDIYTITATIFDLSSTKQSYTLSERATTHGEIVNAVAVISEAIRARLGESLAQIHDNPSLERVTTSNLRALEAYSLGVTSREERNWDEAEQLFLRAIELDPEFAMAHAKLATLYLGALRQFVEGREHLRKAELYSDRLTEYESSYVKGWRARLEGDAEEVVQAWSLMSQLFPEDPVGHYNAGLAYYLFYYDYEKAAVMFEKAWQSNVLARLALVDCLMALGRLDEVEPHLEGLSGSSQGSSELFDYYLLEKRYQEAEDVLGSPEGRASFQPWGVKVLQALVRIDQGRFDQAIELVAEAGAEREVDAGESLDSTEFATVVTQLVLVESKYGDPSHPAVVELLERTTTLGVQLLKSELEHLGPDSAPGGINGIPVPIVSIAGKVIARIGDVESAKILHDQVLAIASRGGPPVWETHALMLEGEILAAEGDLEGAIQKLSGILGTGPEVFQARESMASFYRLAGRQRRALAEYQWVLENRGRGLVECRFDCQAISLFDWAEALLHLAELSHDLGDGEAARRYYGRYLEHRPEGRSQQVIAPLEEGP